MEAFGVFIAIVTGVEASKFRIELESGAPVEDGDSLGKV